MEREDTMNILQNIKKSNILKPDIVKNYNYLEILISVSIHTFIMAIFEIYFYFNYVIQLEKKLFMDKILEYTKTFEIFYDKNINEEQHNIVLLFFPKKMSDNMVKILYEEYKNIKIFFIPILLQLIFLL